MHSRSAPARIIFALLSAVAIAAPASAIGNKTEALDFSTARERSMGGRHVALADDSSVLLTNPAGLAVVPSSFSVADLGIRLIGPVFDIADLVAGGNMTTTGITDFLAKTDYKLYSGLDLAGPLALGYSGGGLGFGLFNKTKFTVNVASASAINVVAGEDLLLAGGYALRIDLGKGHELDAGVVAKGFVLGRTIASMGIVEAMGLTSNPAAVLAKPFTLTTGIGVDMGLRWAWNGLAAGLACRDAFSPAIATSYSSAGAFFSSSPGESTYVSLPRSLDLGLAWTPSLGRLGEVLDGLVIALDYRDILDLFAVVPRNAILNVGLGMEARVLDIVTLRAGISDALPSAGMGLNLSAFTMNISAFGAELGMDPGNRPYYNLLIDFDFKY
jgi:hypothetical protein